MTVATPAPATPMPSTAMNQRSRMTLSTDERMRKTSGIKLLPMARSRPAQRL